MADKKISELTEASPLDGTEDLPLVQAGTTVRCSTQDIADLAIRTVKVSLSSAEILNGNSTPKQAIAAAGANTIIQPISYVTVYTYGSLTYAVNTTLELFYQGINSVGVVSNTILNRTESFIMRQAAASTTAFAFAISTADVRNKPLMVGVQTGNPTTGNGTVDIYITYNIITL